MSDDFRFTLVWEKSGEPTREERDLLDGLAEERRLVNLERDLESYSKWLPETINVGNLAMMTDHVIIQFCDAAEAAAALGRRMLETRKGVRL